MPNQKPSKVIIDTNIWISFLIGKELQNLKNLIVEGKIKLIISDQLMDELNAVTSRAKFKQYFPKDKVTELISLLEIISENIKVKQIEQVCRDPKDDFLLALAKKGKADYLLTGDKDLLELKRYGRTEILTVKLFSEQFR